jgi:hypothetical protein
LYLIRRRKILAVALTVVLLPSTLAMGPCNRQSTLNSAAEAAKDIGGGTRDVIKAVGDAYQAKLITLEQKDRFADLLKAIAQGGQRGVDAIEFLQKQGVETPTAEQRINLMRIFDDDVIAPFLNLLTEIGKLSNAQSVAIRAALASVRTAIVLLSSRIGRADVIRAIEAREVRWNV